jgi:hypothetical protein
VCHSCRHKLKLKAADCPVLVNRFFFIRGTDPRATRVATEEQLRAAVRAFQDAYDASVCDIDGRRSSGTIGCHTNTIVLTGNIFLNDIVYPGVPLRLCGRSTAGARTRAGRRRIILHCFDDSALAVSSPGVLVEDLAVMAGEGFRDERIADHTDPDTGEVDWDAVDEEYPAVRLVRGDVEHHRIASLQGTPAGLIARNVEVVALQGASVVLDGDRDAVSLEGCRLSSVAYVGVTALHCLADDGDDDSDAAGATAAATAVPPHSTVSLSGCSFDNHCWHLDVGSSVSAADRDALTPARRL